MEKYYYVYMLQCSDNSYYIGMTNSCDRRLREHQEGRDPKCYTYKRRPVEKVYTAWFTDVHEAIAWEHKIKRWTRRKKEALIRGDFKMLPKLAECQNETH